MQMTGRWGSVMLTERWCTCSRMRASSSNQQRKSAPGRVVASPNVNKDDGRVRAVFMKAVGNARMGRKEPEAACIRRFLLPAVVWTLNSLENVFFVFFSSCKLLEQWTEWCKWSILVSLGMKEEANPVPGSRVERQFTTEGQKAVLCYVGVDSHADRLGEENTLAH